MFIAGNINAQNRFNNYNYSSDGYNGHTEHKTIISISYMRTPSMSMIVENACIETCKALTIEERESSASAC